MNQQRTSPALHAETCSRSWDYCPECGSKKHHHLYHFAVTHRYCLDCGQEWHTDIDYSKTVASNLLTAIEEIKRLRSLSPANASRLASADDLQSNDTQTP